MATRSKAAFGRTATGDASARSDRFLNFWLFIVACAGVLGVVFRNEILPATFFYDGLAIQGIARGTAGGDSSFIVVAQIYRILGLVEQPLIAGLLGFGVALVLVLIVHRRWGRDAHEGAGVFALYAGVIIASAVYLGFYSKDVFVAVLVTAAVVLARPGRGGEIVVIAAIVCYAAFFRTYWWAVLGIYLVMRILTFRQGFTVRRWIFLTVAASICFAIAILLVFEVPADYFRGANNEYRYATTMIEPFVRLDEPFNGVVNTLLTLVALVIPIPLATEGLSYAVIAVGVLLIWGQFLLAIRGTLSHGSVHVARAISLLGALLATQSIFEPDYGSALRHLTPLLPLVLMVVLYGKRRSEQSQ